MTLGISLLTIAVGAILNFAITTHVAGIDIGTVGVITFGGKLGRQGLLSSPILRHVNTTLAGVSADGQEFDAGCSAKSCARLK